MKTNTIQIIRILCWRPALMPSRDFPAGIRAGGIGSDKGSSAPGVRPSPCLPPAPWCWTRCGAFEIVSLAADILDDFIVRQLKWGVSCSGDLLTCLPEGPSAIPKVATKLGARRLVPLCSIKDKEACEGLLYWVNMLHIGVRVLEWAFVCECSCERGKRCLFTSSCKYGSCRRAISCCPSFWIVEDQVHSRTFHCPSSPKASAPEIW